MTGVQALAKVLYDRDIEKGRLPVGMDVCTRNGMIGLCGIDCEGFEEDGCYLETDPDAKAECIARDTENGGAYESRRLPDKEAGK